MGNELKKIEVAGGPPQTLCTSPTYVGTGAWSKDNVILFGGKPNGPLRRVSAAGGIPTDVTVIDSKRGENYHLIPTFLPDGKHFVYTISGSPEVSGVYVGSLDAKPAEQSKERLLTTTLGAPYVDGNIFFLREGTLMAQPFDAGKLQLRGEPVPIAEHVGAELSSGFFAVSPTGVLAYRTGASVTTGLQHTWFDRQGKATGTFGEPNNDFGVTLSPDGTRAAERDAVQQSRGDIWLLDFARGVRTRLTFRQSLGSYPVWSPDGSRIAFSAGDSPDTIYEKSASGAGEEKELLKKPGEICCRRVGPTTDASCSTTWQTLPKTGSDMWVLPLEGDRKAAPLLTTDFNEGLGDFSPDGRWVAYVSNESGRSEVYVRPFVASGPSGPSLGEGKWQVSKDGGTNPRWRADGKEIIFSFGPAIMSVDVNGSGAGFQMGTPKQLFTAPANNGWDVTGDGKRFLMIVPPNQGVQTAPTPITVVLNWQADLKK